MHVTCLGGAVVPSRTMYKRCDGVSRTVPMRSGGVQINL